MNDILTKDDISFLKQLAIELKTQDRQYTGKPVVYRIREEKLIVGLDTDYTEDACIILGEDYDTFTNFDEAIEWCEGYLEDIIQEHTEEWEDIKLTNSFYDLHTFIQDSGYEFSTHTGYSTDHEYKNYFLTKKALNEHVKENHYHYKNPEYYIDRAWRNPELERLLEIVEKFAAIKDGE